jgi:monoamine oxidase
MKIGIIGGGISGLYLGHKLNLQGHDVSIFEKMDRLGGRIYTVHHGASISYETGAGRFNKTHKRLFKLLKELELIKSIHLIDSRRSFKQNSRDMQYNDLVGNVLFNRVLKAYDTYDHDILKTITLKELMIKEIGKGKTQNVIDAFGYNSEFELQNAYTSLRIFKNDFNDNIEYYSLQGGLSQIVDKLEHHLTDNKNRKQGCNINIHINTEVVDYDCNTNIIQYKSHDSKKIKSEKFDKVVFCITKQTMMKFNTMLNHDNKLLSYLSHTIEMSPLHRIFAKFPTPNGKAWFDNITRITTNLPIRYIIPLNPLTGLIQISYTDKQYADYWNSFPSDNDVIDELIKNLRILFPNIDIPRPLWIERHYWKEGATYWLPNATIRKYNNRRDNPYYICGEMTSQFHSGWIEGALESVDKVMRFF